MRGLFEASEAWGGDPVNPAIGEVTPPEIIAKLTRPKREERVRNLTIQANAILQEALGEARGRDIVATCLLFSGGNDSTVLAHLFKDSVTHAVHANTGIGIEETRQFVRDTCEAWRLPLIEKHPPTSYRELVIDQGFPGPALHYKMYQRLKERCLSQVRRDFVTNGRKQRIVFIAGRRRSESARRNDIPLHEVKDSIIWASPLAAWTKLDLSMYRLMNEVPVNSASESIGMSGECLCGAFAKPGELDRLAQHFPYIKTEIEGLEAEVRAAGWSEPYCTWGHGKGLPSGNAGPMCTSCTAPDPLWALIEGAAL